MARVVRYSVKDVLAIIDADDSEFGSADDSGSASDYDEEAAYSDPAPASANVTYVFWVLKMRRLRVQRSSSSSC